MVTSTRNPIGTAYPFRRGNQGYFQQTFTTEDTIKANLINLIHTRKGERPMQPEFGTNLPNLLFENIDEDYLLSVEEAIRSSIEEWMPFVVIHRIESQMDETNNKVYVKMTFSAINDNINEIITEFEV